MENKIIEFSETIAPIDFHDEQGSIGDAERDLTEFIESLKLSHVLVHNGLMTRIDRYRQISERGAQQA